MQATELTINKEPMSQEEARKTHLRECIAKLLRGAPRSLSGASVQTVRNFTELHKKTTKRLEQRTLSLQELESTHLSLEQLYK